MLYRLLLSAILISSLIASADACTICAGINQTTLRQNAEKARIVVYGTMTNPRLHGQLGGGLTDVVIEQVIKPDPFLKKDQKQFSIPRYIPVDPKTPPKFLLFCDVINNQLDAYRGTPVKSDAVVDYLKGGMSLDGKDPIKGLQYAFGHLDSADTDIAQDAFLEIARANDAEVATLAKQIKPERLRKLLTDPKTPAERLGLFAYLLGGCGGEQDAALLYRMLHDPTENARRAMSGLFAGYISLKPKEGWQLVVDTARDEKKPFPARMAALTAVRFFYGAKSNEVRSQVLATIKPVLPQGDLADLAIEDLRRWQLWDLTPEVLAQFGQKSHDAPIMKRCIVRYALCCPKPEAKSFVDRLTKQDAELVNDVKESLEFEKPIPPTPKGK